jgi:hypothetical protein
MQRNAATLVRLVNGVCEASTYNDGDGDETNDEECWGHINEVGLRMIRTSKVRNSLQMLVAAYSASIAQKGRLK